MGALADKAKVALERCGCVVTEITQYAYDFGQRRFHVAYGDKQDVMIISSYDKFYTEIRPEILRVAQSLGLVPKEFVQMELPL